MRLGKGIKGIIPNLEKTRNAVNEYVNSNTIERKTRLNSSMDVSSETLQAELPEINRQSKRYATMQEVLANNYDYSTVKDFTVMENIYTPHVSSAPGSFSVSLNSKPIKETKLYYNDDGVLSFDLAGSLDSFVWADNSEGNNKIVKNAFEIKVDGSSFGKEAVITQNKYMSTFSFGGGYSLLPEKNEKLHNADRDFMNSVLSLATYTSHDSWVRSVNEKLANGQVLSANDVISDNSLFPGSSDLDRVLAGFYATTFKPAKIMPNGEFEALMGTDDKAQLGNFEFKDGVYRSNKNLCSSSALLSENDDGTYTLHMAYRGTDNDSRSSGKFSDIEKKYSSIKAFNSLVRFGKYVIEAYSDMGKHHENFTPFDKACLEFAKNPANKIKNIEVSGHSLGGAMVQRFLKSDILLESGLKDKVQGITWGAPQTNANVLGKSLVLTKRLIGDTYREFKDSLSKSYIEFLAISARRGYSKNVSDILSPGIMTRLIIKNVGVNSVFKIVPNFLKFTKNVSLATFDYSKKIGGAIAESLDNFNNDVVNDVRLNKNKRSIEKMLSGKKSNSLTDAIDITSDHMIAASTSIPKALGPLASKVKDVWADLSQADLPESKLRQYAHHKDPIPLVTHFFASNVGVKRRLDNEVDKIPVWNHMMKNWDAEISKDILSNEVKPEAKNHGLLMGGIKAGAVFLGNIVDTVSMGKHSMKKYTMNTLMRDSMFRRVNISAENPSFNSVSERDQDWLVNTPNMTKFEVLLHSTRLENIIVEDAKVGTQFRDHRDLYVRKFGAYDETDQTNDVSKNMNVVLVKLEKLYSKNVSALGDGFSKGVEFKGTKNETPNITYKKQRSWSEKMDDNAAMLNVYIEAKKALSSVTSFVPQEHNPPALVVQRPTDEEKQEQVVLSKIRKMNAGSAENGTQVILIDKKVIAENHAFQAHHISEVKPK